MARSVDGANNLTVIHEAQDRETLQYGGGSIAMQCPLHGLTSTQSRMPWLYGFSTLPDLALRAREQ